MDILLDISHCKTYIMANIYTYIHRENKVGTAARIYFLN